MAGIQRDAALIAAYDAASTLLLLERAVMASGTGRGEGPCEEPFDRRLAILVGVVADRGRGYPTSGFARLAQWALG